MLTDIEIAQQTKLIPIDQLAHEYGLSDDQFIPCLLYTSPSPRD